MSICAVEGVSDAAAFSLEFSEADGTTLLGVLVLLGGAVRFCPWSMDVPDRAPGQSTHSTVRFSRRQVLVWKMGVTMVSGSQGSCEE